ncbi:sensor histidine kinase [Candidatus Laterigemmans baculatus]|uniref:sensor histidine kinase n=1 Tax=Candidatus Laterigemmans baculatus TaxID=2770505 RepID=UPI00193B6875|nr:ATP-binding protein [Candidatus Laterigemmans baculatus]
MTLVAGAVVTAGLWFAVRFGATRGAATAEIAVLLIGAMSTLTLAGFAAGIVARRQNLNAALAARLDLLLQTLSEGTAAKTAADVSRRIPAPPTERLIRQAIEAQALLQRRLTKLDSQRRHGLEVLDHMTDGVVAVDAQRRVLLLNPAARHLLRLTRQSLLGRRLAEVVRAPQIVAAVDAVLSGERPGESECDFPTEDERFLKVQALPLAVDGSSGVLITIRDESQMRQLERMRREFIANVSHELKTPLAAVKGYAETLQIGAKEDPETCTHFLTQIGLQAERLERLINDMLQLARAQAGTENLKITHVPLAPVLGESVAVYKPLAEARDISLQFAPPPAAAAVVADREALLTIVNNLVGNAVRYTPEGGLVELRCEEAEGAWKIVVADNGIGIPVQDQERIFERFYRVEKARDASRGGTGLGLSIVKNLLQALGGEVSVRSRPGEGATFVVRLPAMR